MNPAHHSQLSTTIRLQSLVNGRRQSPGTMTSLATCCSSIRREGSGSWKAKGNNQSKASPRKALLEQQSQAQSTISRANFGAAMSDHPSASDEELRRPPAKLGDRTKVDGEAWQVLKKEAMKEKYRLTVEYQRLTPYDKETVNRLIKAQEA